MPEPRLERAYSMPLRFTGQVAMVTSGGSGIGVATALQLMTLVRAQYAPR
jgi:hypothetical protein